MDSIETVTVTAPRYPWTLILTVAALAFIAWRLR